MFAYVGLVDVVQRPGIVGADRTKLYTVINLVRL